MNDGDQAYAVFGRVMAKVLVGLASMLLGVLAIVGAFEALHFMVAICLVPVILVLCGAVYSILSLEIDGRS